MQYSEDIKRTITITGTEEEWDAIMMALDSLNHTERAIPVPLQQFRLCLKKVV